MRIAISTDRDYVSAHFGRCPSFTIVDIEDGRIKNKKIIDNPGHQPGLIPQFLKKNSVEFIIAGGMGAKATSFFDEFNIKPIVGICGKVDEVIEQFIHGRLDSGESLCKPGLGKGYGVDKTECDHPDTGC